MKAIQTVFVPPLPLRYWLIIFFRKKIGEWLRTHSLGNSWEFCFILKGSQYELQWFGYQESSVDYCIYCCPRGLIWYGSCFPYFMGEETEAQLVSAIAYGLQTHACLIPEALGSRVLQQGALRADRNQARATGSRVLRRMQKEADLTRSHRNGIILWTVRSWFYGLALYEFK